jgi:hypothetical protein
MPLIRAAIVNCATKLSMAKLLRVLGMPQLVRFICEIGEWLVACVDIRITVTTATESIGE